MTKLELIDSVASKLNMTKKDVKAVYEAISDVQLDALYETGKIYIGNIGTVSVKTYDAKKCYNFTTQETVALPSQRRLKIKASPTVKAALNA